MKKFKPVLFALLIITAIGPLFCQKNQLGSLTEFNFLIATEDKQPLAQKNDIERIQVFRSALTKSFSVQFALKPAAQTRLTEYTSQNIGKFLIVTLNDEVLA